MFSAMWSVDTEGSRVKLSAWMTEGVLLQDIRENGTDEMIEVSEQAVRSQSLTIGRFTVPGKPRLGCDCNRSYGSGSNRMMGTSGC